MRNGLILVWMLVAVNPRAQGNLAHAEEKLRRVIRFPSLHAQDIHSPNGSASPNHESA